MTVSYFEWVSNVSHMRFGRLSRQLDMQRGRRIIDMIETASGRPVPDELKAPLLRGVDELDLVQSGLEDTMREAYGAMREDDAQVGSDRGPAHGRLRRRVGKGRALLSPDGSRLTTEAAGRLTHRSHVTGSVVSLLWAFQLSSAMIRARAAAASHTSTWRR